jgi:hypothetical protein
VIRLNHILAPMLYSGDPLEANAIYEGQSAYGDLPLCIPLKTFFLHGAIRGKTGTGKTLEAMRQILKLCCLQAPQRLDYLRVRGQEFEEYSIVQIEQKEDDASFNSSRIAASFADMKFRVLDPRIGARSNVYNPFKQRHHEFMSGVQRLEELISALGLIHASGSGYGEYFYTYENARRLGPPFDANGDEAWGWDKAAPWFDSFRKLGWLLDWDANFLKLPGATREMIKNGSHVAGLCWFLSKIHPLNVTAETDPGRDDLFENAIDASSLFHDKQFVHVTVPWGDFPLTGTTIVNLLLMQIFNAGRHATSRGTRKYRVIVYLDEAQHALSEQLVKQFAQARSNGITLAVVHQQRDQLRYIGGKDLRSHVDENLAWSIDLDASGDEMIDWIQKHSPTAMRVYRTIARPVESIHNLDDDAEYAISRALETAEDLSFVEHEEPLYSRGEILALNSTGRCGWLRVPLDTDNLRLEGAVVPFFWRHHLTLEQYRKLASIPRSVPARGTLVVKKAPFSALPKPESLDRPIITRPEKE